MIAWLICAVLFAAPLSRSQQLTAAAEQLLACEKKVAASAGESVDDILFGDVLALLDAAVHAGPQNLHARALRAQLLLHQSFDGADYDVCYLLDARTDAEFVLTRAANAAPADVTIARSVLKGIDLIPPDAIPDPPSICDAEEEPRRGTRTKTP